MVPLNDVEKIEAPGMKFWNNTPQKFSIECRREILGLGNWKWNKEQRVLTHVWAYKVQPISSLDGWEIKYISY